MSVFFEPLILYAVLFFRISSGAVQTGPVEFSLATELARIFTYTVPSLALVWYLMLKVKSLKEWGVSFPKKSDIIPALLSFPALVLISLSISFVSSHFTEIPAGPRFLPPVSVVSWAALVVSCVSSAYLEESFFRFYLLSKREEMKLGPLQAVTISTVLFSSCHVYEGPWGFLNAALSGSVLALVFLRFRSLHGISIAHALYNILVYALL
jgi:membrane protease YdiL (CAAX protease family)